MSKRMTDAAFITHLVAENKALREALKAERQRVKELESELDETEAALRFSLLREVKS